MAAELEGFDPEKATAVAAKVAPAAPIGEDEDDDPYDGVKDKLREHGIPMRLWGQVFSAYDLNRDMLIKLYKSSMDEHSKARAKNPGLPIHFGNLLKYKIEQIMGVFK